MSFEFARAEESRVERLACVSDELLANLSIIVGFIAELNYKNDNTNFVITFHNDKKGSI